MYNQRNSKWPKWVYKISNMLTLNYNSYFSMHFLHIFSSICSIFYRRLPIFYVKHIGIFLNFLSNWAACNGENLPSHFRIFLPENFTICKNSSLFWFYRTHCLLITIFVCSFWRRWILLESLIRSFGLFLLCRCTILDLNCFVNCSCVLHLSRTAASHSQIFTSGLFLFICCCGC